MGRLPEPPEQEWLLESLGLLLDTRGRAPFERGPLRLPTHDHFPDPWEGDLASMDRLCTRILGYCGMDGYRLRLERFEGDRSIDGVSSTGELQYRHHGAAAWFAGVEGKTIRFGCADRQLAEAGEGLVGIMAHEVAHAYRTIHGLVHVDRDVEERLTDLTTVYLGFGVFTVNNTFRFTSYGHGALGSGYSMSQAGYLGPEAMSFLFAAQILCRELGCMATRRLLGYLGDRQRGHTKAALRALRPVQELRDRLR